jgi:hypothetical protein
MMSLQWTTSRETTSDRCWAERRAATCPDEHSLHNSNVNNTAPPQGSDNKKNDKRRTTNAATRLIRRAAVAAIGRSQPIQSIQLDRTARRQRLGASRQSLAFVCNVCERCAAAWFTSAGADMVCSDRGLLCDMLSAASIHHTYDKTMSKQR